MLTNLTRRLAHRACRSAASRFRHYASLADRRQLDLQLARLQLDGGIPTWTSRAELEALYRLAKECPRGGAIVEIGSYLGASTCYLAAGAQGKDARIFCIDTWGNETMPDGERDTFNRFRSNIAGVEKMVTVVRKRSAELRSDDVPQPVHLAFIDADHSYEATKADADFLLPLMAADGVVAFHDTSTFAGVSRALGEILIAGEWCVAGHADHLTWFQRAHWSPWPVVPAPAPKMDASA